MTMTFQNFFKTPPLDAFAQNITFKGLCTDSLYPTFSAMKNDLKTFSNPIQKFQTPTLSFFFTWNML